MVFLQIFLAAAAARLKRGVEVEVVLPQIDDAARDVGAVVRDALQIRQDIRQDEARLNAAKEAKRIVINTIQRTATETAIENAVTTFPI